MMLLASLLIVISLGGSYGRDYECFRREDNCDRGSLPDHPPETPEDLLKSCRAIAELGTCVADAIEICDPDDKEIEEIRHAVGYLSTTCHEDNPTFEVISSNLDCVKKVAKTLDGSCLHTFGQDTLEAMMEHVQPLIENEQTEALECLEHLMNGACIALKFVHNCGDRVGEAVEDILMNIKARPATCTPEILEEIYPLLEGLGSIVRDEMATWNELNRKRK